MSNNKKHEVQVFDFNNKKVTVIIDKEGNPWWIAKEVCAILEINQSQVRRLDADEKGLHLMQTPGGMQNFRTVNEPGLYNLIIGSDKPAAKVFKRWVTHEVLPAIRKTGGYIHGAEEMSDEEILARALEISEAIIKERDRRIESQQKLIGYWDV